LIKQRKESCTLYIFFNLTFISCADREVGDKRRKAHCSKWLQVRLEPRLVAVGTSASAPGLHTPPGELQRCPRKMFLTLMNGSGLATVNGPAEEDLRNQPEGSFYVTKKRMTNGYR